MKTFSFSDWLVESGSPGLRNYSGSQSYNRMSWVYACVNTTATTAASAPLAFYQGEPVPSNRITDKNHPVNQLFQTPKEPEIPSLRALLRITFSYLGISGQIWWVFERKKGRLVSIDAKQDLKPIFAKNNIDLIGWEWREPKNGTLFKYLPEQVLPILYFNPGDAYSGLSPLAAARLSIESEFNISGWNSSFFKTGMKNPLLLQAKGTLTKDQKQEIKKEITNYYSGIEGGHGAVLLQGNIDVKPLTMSPKDVDFVMGKKLNREEICAIYGVPPALVGIFEYANYSNVKEQRKIFWENTLLPRMDQIADLIQVNVLDKEFPGIICKWDTSQILGLRPEAKDVADAAKKYAEIGYSPSQIAIILNVPELDQEIVAPAMTEPSAQTPGTSSPPTQEPQPQQESFPRNHDAFVRWARGYGKIDHGSVEPIIDTTSKRIEEYIEHLSSVKNKSVKLDETKWINLWKDSVGRELHKAGLNGMQSAVIALKAVKDQGKITDVKSAEKQIPYYMSSELKKRIEEMVNESLDIAKQLINDTTALIKNIKTVAYTLAKNLVLSIRERIKYMTLKSMGVTKLAWVAGDEMHESLHGSVTDSDELFHSIVSFHPRDKGMSLGDVHNCSCTVVPMEFIS